METDFGIIGRVSIRGYDTYTLLFHFFQAVRDQCLPYTLALMVRMNSNGRQDKHIQTSILLKGQSTKENSADYLSLIFSYKAIEIAAASNGSQFPHQVTNQLALLFSFGI